ncbi:MAG: hypothetical protein L3K14_01345 [Thermoplasmata archaeon]|nr:hypothetical protein [Thermoplasmata archaeon]
MTQRESGRQARLGGLMLLGAALVATAALGLEWPFAPGFLQNPLLEIPLVAAGVLILFTALLSLVLDRLEPIPAPREWAAGALASPQSSLMALPAIVGKGLAGSPVPSSVPDEGAGAVGFPASAREPAGFAAEGSITSTLLIPFVDEPIRPAPTPPNSTPGQSVSRLVDRMETLQRVAPNGSPRAAIPSASPSGPPISPLLLRLSRIPSPPTATSSMEAARRCNDCGEPLGSPPHFEPCGDCGRALCERCYWRTSSGPRAHLCAVCVQERSVPRPPALSFPRPGLAASVSDPSGRPLPPRRRVS